MNVLRSPEFYAKGIWNELNELDGEPNHTRLKSSEWYTCYWLRGQLTYSSTDRSVLYDANSCGQFLLQSGKKINGHFNSIQKVYGKEIVKFRSMDFSKIKNDWTYCV